MRDYLPPIFFLGSGDEGGEIIAFNFDFLFNRKMGGCVYDVFWAEMSILRKDSMSHLPHFHHRLHMEFTLINFIF
jgi:hypothetical protein